VKHFRNRSAKLLPSRCDVVPVSSTVTCRWLCAEGGNPMHRRPAFGPDQSSSHAERCRIEPRQPTSAKAEGRRTRRDRAATQVVQDAGAMTKLLLVRIPRRLPGALSVLGDSRCLEPPKFFFSPYRLPIFLPSRSPTAHERLRCSASSKRYRTTVVPTRARRRWQTQVREGHARRFASPALGPDRATRTGVASKGRSSALQRSCRLENGVVGPSRSSCARIFR
jgi:hypothetical protein